MDYQYPISKTKSRHILFLQFLFVAIGVLLITGFVLIFREDPDKAQALYSPLLENSEQQQTRIYSYRLLSADEQKIIYKETVDNLDNLKLVDLSDNSNNNIVTAKRVGFGGFLNNHTFLYLVDNEGLSQFTVYQYNLYDHTSVPYIKFTAPQSLTTAQLDQLMSVSADGTKMLINQQSGIILYDIDSTTESVIFNHDSCSSDNCKTYRQPVFISQDIFVSQLNGEIATPMLINAVGNIKTVFQENVSQISFDAHALPALGVIGDRIYLMNTKKSAELIKSENGTLFESPLFAKGAIIAVEKSPFQSTIVSFNRQGKSRKVLKQFSKNINLSSLVADNDENVFFLRQSQSDSSLSVDFVKIGEELKFTNLYSIVKSL